MNFKWLTVPFTNATRKVKAVQTYEVRWQSRFGKFSTDVRPEVETFLSAQEADDFVDSLRNAFKLIRHTSGTDITVTKSK